MAEIKYSKAIHAVQSKGDKIRCIRKRKGITIKLLMDVSRTFGCENAMNNYNLLKQYPCEDIIGIGLGGAEAKGPAKDFAPVYEKALKEGWHAVVHAGEDVGPESIWDSINYLHTERIGHGITAIQDEKLMDELKKTNIWTYAVTMNGQDYRKADFRGGVALVIGSEEDGISRLVLEKCDGSVSLPMTGKIESLNASVAAGIIMYQVLSCRQEA